MAILSVADAFGQTPNHEAGADATNDVKGAVWIYREGVPIPDDVTRVCVPASVTTLPACAFHDHTDLTEVDLTEGLLSIGVEAFANCTSLRRVELPSTLVSIDKLAFHGCGSLSAVNHPEGLRLSEGLLIIGVKAFSGCTSLRRVELPSTLVRIGEYAFWACSSLSVVNLPEGLEYIGHDAFKFCHLLKRIELPSTLEDICLGAFLCCNSLEEVRMTGGILDIGEGAFHRCVTLDRITIPSPAFVLSDGPVRHCRLVTDGHLAIQGRIPRQTIIALESLASIPLAKLVEIEPIIGEILNDREETKKQKYEPIRALIKYHASMEISTILELALWKKKMAEFDGLVLDVGARVECRTRCGADAIMPCVLSYV